MDEILFKTLLVDDFHGDWTTIYRGFNDLTINKMGIWVDVIDRWWLVDD